MKNKVSLTDLRLGNWLYDSKPSGFPMQVSAIGKDWVQLDFEGNEGDCLENSDKEIYPIPLTLEFLNSASGEKVCKEYIFYIGSIEFILNIKNDVIYITPTININEYNIGEEIRYIHELQNIYHALTNKELEIEREWL